jgi:xanthine dehydrogenase accessory factor
VPGHDLEIFSALREWHAQEYGAALATVVRTYGSSPRPAGSMAAIRDDGAVVGSVSGGCIEQDLIERARNGLPTLPQCLSYGGTPLENQRIGLPCGGRLEIVFEPAPDAGIVEQLCTALQSTQPIARRLDLAAGSSTLYAPEDTAIFAWDGGSLVTVHRPQLRLLIIGAVHTARYLAEMAQALEYAVLVCDPREEYRATWNVAGATLLDGMPDDAVQAIRPDVRTAIIALTHDPKLDDMALMEALHSEAFYIGALGSRRNQAKRRERLALLDLAPEQIAKLRGPVGLPIGSHTPAEIAVAILADLIAVRNGIALIPAQEQLAAAAPRAALSA